MYTDDNITGKKNQGKVVVTRRELPRDVYDFEFVKASVQGEKYLEATHMEKPVYPHVVRLDKERYQVISTGEVKEYCRKDTKSVENVRKSMETLKGLIRTNFTETAENQLFITLTYKKNMRDAEQLYTDFKKFFQKLKRAKSTHKFEYIAVAEPQGRGAWHLHVLLKSTNQAVLFIDNKELSKIWGHGFTDTQRMDMTDDVATYFMSYFTCTLSGDGESLLADEEEAQLSSAEKSKRRVKGGRLHLYPVGFRFYRTSRGIRRPDVVTDTVGSIKGRYGEPKVIETYNIMHETDDTRRQLNAVTRLSFEK